MSESSVTVNMISLKLSNVMGLFTSRANVSKLQFTAFAKLGVQPYHFKKSVWLSQQWLKYGLRHKKSSFIKVE